MAELSSTIILPANGFVKRFEDVNKKPMILFVRATDRLPDGGMGVSVVPLLFDQKQNTDEITTAKTDVVKVPMQTAASKAPETGDFFQVLTGDTRYINARCLALR